MVAGAARASSDSNPGHPGPRGWTLALALSVLTFMLAGCSSQNFTPAPLSSRNYYAPSQQSYGTSRTQVIWIRIATGSGGPRNHSIAARSEEYELVVHVLVI